MEGALTKHKNLESINHKCEYKINNCYGGIKYHPCIPSL